MPAKDIFHEQVRNALTYDGWSITHDPLTIKYKGLIVYIDLGAERRFKDETGERRIAIEVKVLGGSLTSDFEKAVGQYRLYRFMLRSKGLSHELFLAIPQETYDSLQDIPALIEFISEEQISLLIFDAYREEVVQWIK
ncbi:MAG: hypothetical protein L0Z50_24890 [Verrucomicrobiales bacterium]|nr:hypothetical protein [Verrucomicrobiales bacterium]